MSAHLEMELSAYLDGELAAAELAAVEQHLAACAECRATLEDLKRLVRRAGSLDDRPPERDLWRGIAARLGEGAGTADVVPLASRRRFAFTLPQLAAAAVALVVVSAGTAMLVSRDGIRPAPVATAAGAPEGATVVSVSLPSQRAVDSYDAAIRELELTLAQRRGTLDTSTVRVLEQSLRLIDVAIGQAREALARDPDNQYLNGHLQRALDRKLDLLRRTALLPVS